MNILLWTDGFWPRIGGVETQTLRFVEGLHKRGHRIEVMANKDSPHWEDRESRGELSIGRFDFESIFPKKNLKPLRQIGDHLEWILRTFKPDIVHLNACVGWSVLVFLLFRRRFSVPVVLTVHSPLFYMQEQSPLLEKICLQVDQICCVSNWTLIETMNLVPSFTDKSRVIYNGLPMPSLSPSELPFSPPILLSIGRFTWEKGFKTAITAFALLKHPTAKFLIVGDGNDRPMLKSLVRELNIEHSVSFLGAVDPSEVHSSINRATLVIVPSHFESFGLVALEAMQMGRPVIASAVGGLKELVSDGQTGILVPPEDPASLAKAMGTLLQNPEMAVEMGVQGRNRAMELFTLDQNIDQYEKLYRELL